MKKGGVTLSEVQVTGQKPVYMIDGEKTFYNVSEDPAVQSGNVSDALQNAPGGGGRCERKHHAARGFICGDLAKQQAGEHERGSTQIGKGAALWQASLSSSENLSLSRRPSRDSSTVIGEIEITAYLSLFIQKFNSPASIGYALIAF